MSIIKAIEVNHFGSLKKHTSWDFVYYALDLHGTVLIPNYEAGNIPKEFYPYAKEVLLMLSDRDDVVMFMYTCSHPHEREEYVEYFKELGIDFKWVNENPEVLTQNNGYGHYDDKPYFNVLLEDKAGFDPLEDWEDIRDYFRGRDSFILRNFYKLKRLFKNGI